MCGRELSQGRDNQGVTGSFPSLGSKKTKGDRNVAFFSFYLPFLILYSAKTN